jgi:Fur family peroxide stress response transcriptional regulator
MLRDVSPHHGTWRVDANTAPHHHLICTRCHSISDLDIDFLQPVKLQGKLPSGFRMEKFNVEVQGVCKACAANAAGGDRVKGKARIGS